MSLSKLLSVNSRVNSPDRFNGEELEQLARAALGGQVFKGLVVSTKNKKGKSVAFAEFDIVIRLPNGTILIIEAKMNPADLAGKSGLAHKREQLLKLQPDMDLSQEGISIEDLQGARVIGVSPSTPLTSSEGHPVIIPSGIVSKLRTILNGLRTVDERGNTHLTEAGEDNVRKNIENLSKLIEAEVPPQHVGEDNDDYRVRLHVFLLRKRNPEVEVSEEIPVREQEKELLTKTRKGKPRKETSLEEIIYQTLWDVATFVGVEVPEELKSFSVQNLRDLANLEVETPSLEEVLHRHGVVPGDVKEFFPASEQGNFRVFE